MGVEHTRDIAQIEQLRLFGPLDGASQVMGRDDGGEVEERS